MNRRPHGDFQPSDRILAVWREEARKRKAQAAASKFARLHGIERPSCECLSTKQVEMHHIDYDRPYLVAFMCCRCHSNEHHGNLKRHYRLYDLVEIAAEKTAREQKAGAA